MLIISRLRLRAPWRMWRADQPARWIGSENSFFSALLLPGPHTSGRLGGKFRLGCSHALRRTGPLVWIYNFSRSTSAGRLHRSPEKYYGWASGGTGPSDRGNGGKVSYVFLLSSQCRILVSQALIAIAYSCKKILLSIIETVLSCTTLSFILLILVYLIYVFIYLFNDLICKLAL